MAAKKTGPGGMLSKDVEIAIRVALNDAHRRGRTAFVLDEMLRTGGIRGGEKGVLGAFGPGFGAEFALLEFC